jgi:gamma-glutamyltranspeptidase/glutathione hydrolase
MIGGDHTPAAGEWFTNPDYARTLRQIAKEGPSAMYGGSLGKRVADFVAEKGGFLTLDDLKSHGTTWLAPLSVPFKGYRLWELPPNGQGVAALEMLRLLEPFDLAAMGHNSAQYLHHLIEAKKLAYADLDRYVADPKAMDIAPEALLSDAYIDSRRRALDPKRAADRVEPGQAATASETIYLSAADSSGNMVSLINSTYWEFGSGVVVPGTGFALQNRGAGFTLEPGLPNTVGPGKLPLHTIIPAFVTKTSRPTGVSTESAGEQPWLSFGVMGGAMQPQGHVQVLLNLLTFGMGLQEAIDAPRFRHMSGRTVALEAPIPAAVRRTLEAMGHVLTDESRVAFGGAQAVMRLERGWVAASDPRKDGMAAGY